MPIDTEQQKIDFRIYIGILFFRWQVIVICFLYSLLAGVLYIHLAPKKFITKCKVMIYRDPALVVSNYGNQWKSYAMHSYMLKNKKFGKFIVKKLIDEWGEKIGSPRKMLLEVKVDRDRGISSMLNLSLKSNNSSYGKAFMETLIREHIKQWEGIQMESSDTVANMLQDELDRLEEKIRTAEDKLIEYQRLHDITRVEAKGSMESQYLTALMGRRNQLVTELMLLEAQYPALKDANATVISDVNRLTRETGTIEPFETEKKDQDQLKENTSSVYSKVQLPAALKGDKYIGKQRDDMGWRDLRVKLTRLYQKEKKMAANLKPEHPQVKSVRKEIENIQNKLELAAKIELGKLKDRHKALTIQLNALESAEYKWQAKNLLASQRRAELKHLSSVVGRFEVNYQTLYTRLHDMKISEELKAEHFRIIEHAYSDEKPVWPDPVKVLFVALVVGLGSGFGLVLLAQTFDNKVQSIKDVEKGLGVAFLGGIPYWVHSNLEKAVRPIVTEEESSGAIEAYRALRTSVMSALNKNKEKIIFVTSADSKEGKTLTTLNMAIMTAQIGKKVLLIDMDIRRGRLHRSLGVERQPGVSDVLREKGSLKDVILQTKIENLDFIPTGSFIENAAELLQSWGTKNIFQGIINSYDYIFVDTSPVLRVTDTVIITTQGIGAVVYVARVNRTPKPLVQYSLNMLRDANVIGLIMNSIEMHKISSLYYTYQYPNYAYYSNAYAYGYDHYYSGDSSKKRNVRRRRSSLNKKIKHAAEWLRKTFLPLE